MWITTGMATYLPPIAETISWVESLTSVVNTVGHAYRLERRKPKQAFDQAGLLQRILLRYTQALMTQMVRTAAYNRHHSLEQQLCPWLLLTIDRLTGNELVQ